jgi:hypothetical protein
VSNAPLPSALHRFLPPTLTPWDTRAVRCTVMLLAALSLLAAAPGGAPAAKTKAYNCGATSVTILLWPHGHKAIRSVHFPAGRTPNIQVYRYDPNFRGGNFLFYADAKGNVHGAPGYCVPGRSQASTPIAAPRTLTGKRAVTCTVSATQTFEVTRSARGIKVLGRMAGTTLWIATATRSRTAKITFDSSACETGPSPP